MTKLIKLILSVCGISLTSLSFGVSLSGHHVFMLYPALDNVQGSYLFMVSNDSSEPQKGSIGIDLPKEAIDFKPHDGLGEDEVRLGEGGGLVIEKEFKPGDSLLSVWFKLPSSSGEGTLTVVPQNDIGKLSVFVRKGGTMKLNTEGQGFEVKSGVQFGGAEYDSYSKENIKKGTSQSFSYSGVREGRGRYWWLGGILAVCLVAGAVVLGLKTKPQDA